MARHPQSVRNAAALAAVLLLAGCAPSGTFDPIAFEQTKGLKAEALALMDRAAEPFADHRAEVDTLRARLSRAYAREQGRPDNAKTLQQWDLLMAPQGHLLAGFLALWERRSTLDEPFIDEARVQVADAFDEITGLENGKLRRD